MFSFQLQTLFFISFAARLVVVLYFFRKFREPHVRVDAGTLELVNEGEGIKAGMETVRQVFRPSPK